MSDHKRVREEILAATRLHLKLSENYTEHDLMHYHRWAALIGILYGKDVLAHAVQDITHEAQRLHEIGLRRDPISGISEEPSDGQAQQAR